MHPDPLDSRIGGRVDDLDRSDRQITKINPSATILRRITATPPRAELFDRARNKSGA
jgi:hypothetical protein